MSEPENPHDEPSCSGAVLASSATVANPGLRIKPRLMWRTRLHESADHDCALESLYDTLSGVETRLEPVKTLVRHWERAVCPAAFVSPAPASAGWSRREFRNAAIPLNAFAPYSGPSSPFASLGIPSDLGGNGWVCAPYDGRLLVAPSISLLQVLAMPSRSVWLRLRHPLNMDVVLRNLPDDAIELRAIYKWALSPKLNPFELACLAFWLEDERLPCLWSSLEDLGSPGWTLKLPRRSERINFMFDAYTRGELIVAHRFAVPFVQRHWPGSWRSLTYHAPNGPQRRGLCLCGDELNFLSS